VTWQNSSQKSEDRLDDDGGDEGRFAAEPVRGFSENVRPQKNSDHESGLKCVLKCYHFNYEHSQMDMIAISDILAS
jgi:hypothetical protein